MTFRSAFRLALMLAAGLIFLAPGASATIGPLPNGCYFTCLSDRAVAGQQRQTMNPRGSANQSVGWIRRELVRELLGFDRYFGRQRQDVQLRNG